MTIGKMTCDQTRRERRGPVGSESTYGLLPGHDRDVDLTWSKCWSHRARRYDAQDCPLELGRTGIEP
jgi:hypothetical protein